MFDCVNVLGEVVRTTLVGSRASDTVPVAEYERFGSDALADLVALALKDRRGALLRNHGAVTYGSSLAEAYDLAVLLEWLARIYWQAKQLGEPRLLTADQVEEVAAEARRRRYANTAASIELEA